MGGGKSNLNTFVNATKNPSPLIYANENVKAQ
jgi:hypothetical protein